jgi:hypothetical protein
LGQGKDTVCNCEVDFSFDLDSWRKTLTPLVAPQDQGLTLTLDPSFTARDGSREGGGNTSDESAMGVGWIDENFHVNVLDVVASHFKGLQLPDAVVTLCEKWKIENIKVEQSPFFDLLSDSIRLCGDIREVVIPRISSVRVSTSKAIRFRKLQKLIDKRSVHIRQANFAGLLFDEVENFCFSNKDNHRHPDNRIDAICLLANLR